MATINVARLFMFMNGRNVGIFEFEQVLCQQTLFRACTMRSPLEMERPVRNEWVRQRMCGAGAPRFLPEG